MSTTPSLRGPAAAVAGPRGARLPDREGIAVRDGVRLAWAQYGGRPAGGQAGGGQAGGGQAGGGQGGPPDVVLLPSWSIVPSRCWKGQVGPLARHFRVTTFDGRGSGASDRPRGAAAHAGHEYAADVLAVMADAGVGRAVLVGLSQGASWAVRVAATAPDLVAGVVAIGSAAMIDPGRAAQERAAFLADLPPVVSPDAGWALFNRRLWREGGPEAYEAFVRFFFGEMFHERHSTKQVEDAVGWALEIDGPLLADTMSARFGLDGASDEPLAQAAARVRCPVLVLHGARDRIQPVADAELLAELCGARLELVEGAGHGLPGRHPVLVNERIRAFADDVLDTSAGRPVPPSGRNGTARDGRRRVLFVSSPIGLGHTWRDVAIADALRALRPDVTVDWLAQDPVTRVLTGRGERVHPASAFLASESAHVESEALDHDLHAFQAIRRMDEILVNNFSVFADVVRDDRPYDLVVADEAWEVDFFLHENPGLKPAPYAWITDFVGWLPMPGGGPAEAALTADYNAEMLGHRERLGPLRDLSLFVGNPDDVVDEPFGPGLPRISDWTTEHFRFSGYVNGWPGTDPVTRPALRRALGYGDEPVCLVSVGGTAVGRSLLDRVTRAVPALRRRVPGLRVVMVTGPRIDPRSLPAVDGLEVRGFVPGLAQHLAACDVAVVQGGLSTCMELTANRVPFAYVPLRNHFEQNLHVRHRLERYRAGRCVDYDLTADPDALASVVADLLAAPVDHRPVESDGAERAAALLAGLL